MKTSIKFLIKGFFTISLLVCMKSNAQTQPVLGVLNIEANGGMLDEQSAGNLVRLEIEKTGLYAVVDKHDLATYFERDTTYTQATCLGMNCLIAVGKGVNADKMIGGAIEKFGDKIIISLRLINVSAGGIEKVQIDEYLYLPESIQEMVQVSVQKLFGLPYNTDVASKLSLITEYESEINNPGQTRLVLNGPRTGISFIAGEAANRLMAPKSEGGFDGYPFMFVFGYQQEIQYLNSGAFQALFEIIPAISGMDQGLFIPSLSLLNGFRNNYNGWEFGFGPHFTLNRIAEGFHYQGKWILKRDYNKEKHGDVEFVKNTDIRGFPGLHSAFVFALGKSFKSGRVNIPLNLYVIPGKKSQRLGLIMGFNSKKTDKPEK
ncbi:MAG: hypothetical protein WD077_02345 [Bacteroidia bacterium]